MINDFIVPVYNPIHAQGNYSTNCLSFLIIPSEYHHDCKEIMDKTSGEPHTGVYTIKPDHLSAFDMCIHIIIS